jgi:hypothetical protein
MFALSLFKKGQSPVYKRGTAFARIVTNGTIGIE